MRPIAASTPCAAASPSAPPQPPGRPDTAEALVRPSAIPSRNAPIAASSNLRPIRPAGSSRSMRSPAIAMTGKTAPRRARTGAAAKSLEIGAGGAEPIGRRATRGGAQRRIVRVVRGQRHRAGKAQSDKQRAPAAHGEAAHGFAQRIPPVRRQFALGGARRHSRHVPPPNSSARNPPRGVRGQARTWRGCDERRSGAAMDRADVIIFVCAVGLARADDERKKR